MNIAERIIYGINSNDEISGELNKLLGFEGKTISQSVSIIGLSTKNLPSDVFKAFLKISTSITRHFGDDYTKICFIDNIPFMGKVIRYVVLSNKKIEENNIDFSTIDNYRDFKSAVSKTLMISMYYDEDDVLGIVGKPYFEIYNFIEDPERFYVREYNDLNDTAIDFLKQRIEQEEGK